MRTPRLDGVRGPRGSLSLVLERGGGRPPLRAGAPRGQTGAPGRRRPKSRCRERPPEGGSDRVPVPSRRPAPAPGRLQGCIGSVRQPRDACCVTSAHITLGCEAGDLAGSFGRSSVGDSRGESQAPSDAPAGSHGQLISHQREDLSVTSAVPGGSTCPVPLGGDPTRTPQCGDLAEGARVGPLAPLCSSGRGARDT